MEYPLVFLLFNLFCSRILCKSCVTIFASVIVQWIKCLLYLISYCMYNKSERVYMQNDFISWPCFLDKLRHKSSVSNIISLLFLVIGKLNISNLIIFKISKEDWLSIRFFIYCIIIKNIDWNPISSYIFQSVMDTFNMVVILLAVG